MIVVLLLLILAGSFATAIYVASTGASWGMVALGYVAGGWGGLLLGGVLALLGARGVKTGRGLVRPRQTSPQRGNRLLTVEND